MLPDRKRDFVKDFNYREIASKTYRMKLEDKQIAGYNDKLKAVKQAVFKILNTERYVHPIYSRNYGVEFIHVLGMPISYAVPEIERVIREALLQDDRITAVEDFVFTYPQKGVVLAEFTVVSTQGRYIESKVVRLH